MRKMGIGPELLVTLVNSRVFQVMLLLHVLQQVLHIGVLLLTEAAVLLHLQMDTLYVDLRRQKHSVKTAAHSGRPVGASKNTASTQTQNHSEIHWGS